MTFYFPKSWQKNKDKISQHQNESICPIWGNVKNVSCWSFIHGDYHYYWSPRAGGAFAVTDSLCCSLKECIKSERDKVVFSRWVFEQNFEGNIPNISTNRIEDILKIDDIPLDEKLTRVLTLYNIMSERSSIGLLEINRSSINIEIHNLCYAGANVANAVDYKWLRDAAVKERVLENHIYNGHKYLRLSPKGLIEIQEKRRKISAKQAFVAMWFDKEVDSAYDNSILPAIRATGHTAYRVDRDNSHSDQITNKILAEIKNSKFLIADFTHGADGARGGVYFEAGYALGLGIPVLWLIRKDDVSKMHFDTNHYPHIVWKNEKHLKEQLEAAILAHQHIGKGPQ